MGHDPHQYFVAPARATPELWRTLIGVVMIFIAGLALYQLAFAFLSNLIGPNATQGLVESLTLGDDTVIGTLHILLSFGFFGIALFMIVRGLHHRSPATLFGDWAAVVSDFLRVFLTVGGLFLALMILLPTDIDYVRNTEMPRDRWLLLLPVSLAAVMVQVGTEELVFRGYLQQQLAVRFPKWPLWLVLPSLLFGLLHVSGDAAGPNLLAYVCWTVAFGLAAADLTARTGALGAAIGLHAANNVMAILVASLNGPGSGLALYHIPMAMDDPRISAMMLPELATTLCVWLAARLALKV
ncbi:hypothetical protein CLV78_10324 [Aliiruegeria haliotis]|uniref:CAAX prenyl protease 2/Lysostaphin resistance protein A-like domain-containing protein n=1 Tax=Aliiruegeria haliotis TaxID=1280846 RepID=A0A2T0RSS5_9RHOB|nr:CPBP family intramembrane glutamic endopeptidase [Aliiruegeria haliotis]PRY24160.1 hypothetical protein CLV78_10324 [Aliiruegeria haliotis]